MPSTQDLFIWTTGVVGRAMGSGQFKPEDIPVLTKWAKDAFYEHLGVPDPKAPHTANRPAAAPTAQPAQRGGPQHISAPVQQVMGGAQNDIPPTSEATFSKWGSWGARYFAFGNSDCPNYGKPWKEVTWDEFLQMATQEDPQAMKALQRMATSALEPGKWEKQNRARIANAKCVLGMAAKLRSINQGAGPEMEPEDDGQTPF